VCIVGGEASRAAEAHESAHKTFWKLAES